MKNLLSGLKELPLVKVVMSHSFCYKNHLLCPDHL